MKSKIKIKRKRGVSARKGIAEWQKSVRTDRKQRGDVFRKIRNFEREENEI